MKEKKGGFILCYILITYLVSGIGYFFWLRAENYESPAAFITVLAPLIGALSVYFISGRTIDLKLKGISFRSILTGLGFVASYMAIAICVFLIMGHRFSGIKVTAAIVITGIFQWIFAGFCEEIGWRCVLLPLLKEKCNVQVASILTGIIWFGWHVPLIVTGLMITGQSKGVAMIMFLLETVSISLTLGVISEKKSIDNVWTYVSYHAAHNFIFIFLLKAITKEEYKLLDDGGFVLVTALVVVAILTNFIYIRKTHSKRNQ